MGDERAAAPAAAAGRGSDLPPELWAMIGRRLDSHTDIFRFRSVCATWRSLVPPLSPPHFPLPVPYPQLGASESSVSISPSTIFRLAPVENPPGSRQGWLIKISDSNPELVVKSDPEGEPESELESDSGKIRLLNPLCSLPIHYKRGTFPKTLDLLNFCVTELCKEYSLQGSKAMARGGVEKVLIHPNPNSPWPDPEDTVPVALAINKNGRLLYWKQGDGRWTYIKDYLHQPDLEFRYDDIIVYKGQFYAVDKLGTVCWIDSSMRLVQFSPPMCGGGVRKHLIESGGDIFVIDRYNEGGQNHHNPRHRRFPAEAADFRVYRLDQEWGKWDEVRDLGDEVFFLGTGCSFSVSVRDFSGCPGNCIYFVEVDDFLGARVHVFSLKSRSSKRAAFWPGSLQILWPPPSWVSPIQCIPDPNVPISFF